MFTHFYVALGFWSSYTHAITYVYCGLPDGSDWEWLIDQSGNYQKIEGVWARITESNGRYFNVYRVTKCAFEIKAFNCPAGYIPQPAESGTSLWEIFEIQQPDGTRQLLDGYKSYHSYHGLPSAFRL
ncbi:hypothetical protein [Vibrio pectenicida]|uniref:Uncharacterized protein n=1 Tax=Vibrio pectenicida TaxID=62763 RepID=A0A3R9F2M2_9VIBR|nr:hypothetical protein [Vibrio pectenicida]RSD28534.1 hypothetical protein EJA03_19185 [Vibrio pectenicida]